MKEVMIDLTVHQLSMAETTREQLVCLCGWKGDDFKQHIVEVSSPQAWRIEDPPPDVIMNMLRGWGSSPAGNDFDKMRHVYYIACNYIVAILSKRPAV